MTDQLDLDLTLPYITDQPGIGGKIRQQTSHFKVDEIPVYEPQGVGNHLYVNITKENLTTREVQLRLADLFEIKPEDVGKAGLKDKYAVTTQTFSVLFNDHASPEEITPIIEDNIPVKVNWAKYHNNKIRAGHLIGNKFTILITKPEGSIEQAQAIAKSINETGLPNFYGIQRTGKDGENIYQGWLLLKKKKRLGNRWLRKYLLSSYQSYLCNRYLVKRIEKGLFDKMVHGDIAKKHETGGLFWVEDLETDQGRFDSKEISFTAPMFGYKMSKPKEESMALEEEILVEMNLDVQEFRAQRVKGTRRMGRVLPEITVSDHTEGIQLEFALPKGGFATTLLREFRKIEPTD
ncbi:tRNA pseudouridine(13) synthase TruD [Candidatus Bathyarchaeota archaeon]|jgi:tRNA pseudouridine13 synthase|nr:tRNA pseudouridine(13) synthase TruD [Candidatus Bathyarchaeota archaeon]MBT4424064.1 tRNA pseudouridine(13) synthase TruD [Candidatus Bathyarchaeota archaeon]MBT6604039.1 tRNA pseudouridine(13) synthase TruD [Candidatus Bathyarchaeota archaeon]MBT7188336.1 tRNA pseudouridine(13) synthase TruD [Candidatus Bathyarchaeota archaeon]MBT7345936.1 tRNA pseudouridine(13) synthase TruD [Candidatus Bathyarchaeota archaeon]